MLERPRFSCSIRAVSSARTFFNVGVISTEMGEMGTCAHRYWLVQEASEDKYLTAFNVKTTTFRVWSSEGFRSHEPRCLVWRNAVGSIETSILIAYTFCMSLSFFVVEQKEQRFVYRYFADQVAFPAHRSIDWDAVPKTPSSSLCLGKYTPCRNKGCARNPKRDVVHPRHVYLGYPDITLSTPPAE